MSTWKRWPLQTETVYAVERRVIEHTSRSSVVSAAQENARAPHRTHWNESQARSNEIEKKHSNEIALMKKERERKKNLPNIYGQCKMGLIFQR